MARLDGRPMQLQQFDLELMLELLISLALRRGVVRQVRVHDHPATRGRPGFAVVIVGAPGTATAAYMEIVGVELAPGLALPLRVVACYRGARALLRTGGDQVA